MIATLELNTLLVVNVSQHNKVGPIYQLDNLAASMIALRSHHMERLMLSLTQPYKTIGRYHKIMYKV